MSKRCEDFSRISLFPFKNLKLKPEEKKKEEEKSDFFSIKCTQRRFFRCWLQYSMIDLPKANNPSSSSPTHENASYSEEREGGGDQKVKEETLPRGKTRATIFPNGN